EVLPAGALYFPIIDPFVSADGPIDDDELEEERMKKLRMNGIIIGGKDVIQLMDSQVEAGRESKLIAAGITKKGLPSKRSKAPVIDSEKYEVLSEFLKDKLKDLAEEIRRGEIGIKPYRKGTKRACEHCSYKPV